MLPRKLKLLACVTLAVLLFGWASTVFASPNIQWHTNGVYYDGNSRLVITGYFKNEGTVAIDRINWVTLNVQLQRDDGTWWLAYSANWTDIPVSLSPGEIHRCNLKTSYAVQQYRFQNYQVYGNVNYHLVPNIPDV